MNSNIGGSALNTRSTEDLLARKDACVAELAPLLVAHNLATDYPWNMMMAARGSVTGEAYTCILEHLLEIESIKYTLAARVVRELQSDDEA